jgi:hypothetical protein
MSYNPLLEVIENLKQKELKMTKGFNNDPLVLLKDAISALEDLEVKVWLMCEKEKEQMLSTSVENY